MNGSIVSFNIDESGTMIDIQDDDMTFSDSLYALAVDIKDSKIQAHLSGNWPSIYLNVLAERLDWKSRGKSMNLRRDHLSEPRGIFRPRPDLEDITEKPSKIQLSIDEEFRESFFSIFEAYLELDRSESLTEYLVTRETLRKMILRGKSYDPTDRSMTECGSASFSQLPREDQNALIKMYAGYVAGGMIALVGTGAGVACLATGNIAGVGIIASSLSAANVVARWFTSDRISQIRRTDVRSASSGRRRIEDNVSR